MVKYGNRKRGIKICMMKKYAIFNGNLLKSVENEMFFCYNDIAIYKFEKER